MVDYTWVANLLREIETLTAEGKGASLSESLTIACVALLSETDGKAEISADARIWLRGIAERQPVPSDTSDRNIASALSGKPSFAQVLPVAQSSWGNLDPTLIK